MWATRSRLLVLLLPLLVLMVPPGRLARADEVLLTFGDMLRLRELPLESAKRDLTEEEVTLYRSYQFYTYTAFETLQVANSAARLVNQTPLFCAPEGTFHFEQDGDILRLADHVTDALFELTAASGDPLDRYEDKPASFVLLLGLRATFPCGEDDPTLAQR